jgi:hypothetical protein
MQHATKQTQQTVPEELKDHGPQFLKHRLLLPKGPRQQRRTQPARL